jgi:hypothetical protein
MHLLARWAFPRRFDALLAGSAAVVAAAGVALSSPASALTSATDSASIAASTTPTAASVIKAGTAAIDAQTSAHVVLDASNSTATAESIVGDFGTRGGTETITDGAAVLTVKVTPTGSYVSGTPTGLTSLFRLTAAQATKVGTRWEFWKPKSAEYKSLMKVVSVRSLLSLLPKAKGTTLVTSATGYTLSWNAAATSREPALSNVLIIAATGAKLPVTETSADTAGEKLTTTVSLWGEKLHVKAPSSTMTITASAASG